MNKKLVTSIMGLAVVAAMLMAATTVAVLEFEDHKAHATKDTTSKNNGGGSGTETTMLPVSNKGKIE